ncbi:MAG: peptidoglycan-associated lipoprotein Pal [Gammaproteobacteria bacterium]|nr:peptidoglycan-associated lipoprotein Pal [Gammaproteobacteria bacterium]
MRRLATHLIIAAAALAVAGCGGRQSVVDDAEVEIETVEGVAGADSGDASATGLDDGGTDGQALDGSTGAAGAAGTAEAGDDELLSQRVVYFDYDSSLLREEADAVVRAHARNLLRNPATQIILEGHADERGTREYNLALGEDRAKSVADLMQAMGVGGERIQTISYGEERPVALGHDESAWGLNRRVELLYQ